MLGINGFACFADLFCLFLCYSTIEGCHKMANKSPKNCASMNIANHHDYFSFILHWQPLLGNSILFHISFSSAVHLITWLSRSSSAPCTSFNDFHVSNNLLSLHNWWIYLWESSSAKGEGGRGEIEREDWNLSVVNKRRISYGILRFLIRTILMQCAYVCWDFYVYSEFCRFQLFAFKQCHVWKIKSVAKFSNRSKNDDWMNLNLQFQPNWKLRKWRRVWDGGDGEQNNNNTLR